MSLAAALCALSSLPGECAPMHAPRHFVSGKRDPAKQHNLNAQLIGIATNNGIVAEPVIVRRVRTLLAQGADPNARWVMAGKQSTTLLIAAAAFGELEVAKMLIRSGAHVNARGMSCSMRGMEGDFRDSTPLIDACMRGDDDLIDLLLAHGARVNVRQRGGVSPLSSAIRNAEWEQAETLLRHGAHASRATRRMIMAARKEKKN